ncbi:MAG TPA: MotA/TolQ/ExbB proton channel family protein [bacterium]
MKQGLFMGILLVAAFVLALGIFQMLPDYLRAGGPLVVILIMLSIMVVTFIIERLLALNKAKGRGSLVTFLRNISQHVKNEDIDKAIAACDNQRGSAASVLRAGFERYKVLKSSGTHKNPKETMEEIQHAIEEAMMLEVPLLEKNLVAISTIASISVLVGLTGTVLGMIRSFRALAHAGTTDAVALSQGISEALVNTAGGLICAIMGIIAYNYFVTRIDNFTYMIDEASYSIVQTLAERQSKR